MDLAKQWLSWDQESQTRKEIQCLMDSSSEDQLQDRLAKRIEFGTAGLRARMQAGFAYMNSLIVIQTSQGLAEYLLRSTGDAKSDGVVIGYDGRHNSTRFAELAAATFLAKGIKVHWYEAPVHTPLVAFGVRHLGAAAGVMVTASHNPPQDNGYKVYKRGGSQINTPEDAEIANHILSNLEPLTWDTSIVKGLKGQRQPMMEEYTRSLQQNISLKEAPPFVYTAMHGVGLNAMVAALGPYSHLMSVVKEQALPDPDFPTVQFPNPEELGALDKAKELALKLGLNLVIANDPDADRFAAAEKVGEEFHQFTGDEVGVLLGHYLYTKAKDNITSPVSLTSAVSSQMLSVIGREEGFHVEETLTGFKWLGNRAIEIGPRVVFAYEEALGYMLPSIVFDKDGVATAMLFLEAYARWNGSPYRALQSLYEKYGYFVTRNTYWKSSDISVTSWLLQQISRNPMLGGLHNDGDKILCRIRDLNTPSDTGLEQGKAQLPKTLGMVTVWISNVPQFADGIRYTIRGSGTEPKIKGSRPSHQESQSIDVLPVYIECLSKSSYSAAEAGATEALKAVKATWFEDSRLSMDSRYIAEING